MPELDGLQTTRGLRKSNDIQARNIPVVGVTAYAMHGDRSRCISAGMNDYLTKPIDVKQLSEMVDRYAVASANSRPVDPLLGNAMSDEVPIENGTADLGNGLRNRFGATLARLGGMWIC